MSLFEHTDSMGDTVYVDHAHDWQRDSLPDSTLIVVRTNQNAPVYLDRQDVIRLRNKLNEAIEGIDTSNPDARRALLSLASDIAAIAEGRVPPQYRTP